MRCDDGHHIHDHDDDDADDDAGFAYDCNDNYNV